MLRIGGLILSVCIVAGVSVGSAHALAPLSGQKLDTGAPHSLLIHSTPGKPMSEKQKCKALNRCRYKYTRCYNKLVRDHKSIDESKIECVKPYQKCINASFSGFDFFFTRWFTPEADCSKF